MADSVSAQKLPLREGGTACNYTNQVRALPPGSAAVVTCCMLLVFTTIPLLVLMSKVRFLLPGKTGIAQQEEQSTPAQVRILFLPALGGIAQWPERYA
jgi:hypothetical protein